MFADVILTITGAYAGVGVLFAIGFVTLGVARVDPASREAPVSFRFIIFPGAVVLWPVLAWKWMNAGQVEERD